MGEPVKRCPHGYLAWKTYCNKCLKAELDRLRAERDNWMEYATGDRAELALKTESLRAELAAMTKRAETAEDTVGCQTDLEKDFAAARAELAAAKSKVTELHEKFAYVSDELAEATARIAELEADPTRWFNQWTKEAAISASLRKRVGELEARNKHMETVLYDAQVLLGTEDIGELITGPTGPISRLIARAEQADAKLTEVDKQREDFFWDKRRAEAERDDMREAVRKIRATDNITAVWHIADAALTTSPAGSDFVRALNQLRDDHEAQQGAPSPAGREG